MSSERRLHENVTRSILGAFFTVYAGLGPGFLEHVYVRALERELRRRGHDVARERSVPVFYRGELVASQRLDMIVDGCVVVEVKSTETLSPIAARQLFAYLHGSDLEVGLLLHFGPRKGTFKRIICDAAHKPPRSVDSVDTVDSD